MSTQNLRLGGTTAVSGALKGVLFQKLTHDCAVTSLGNGNTVQIFDVPAGWKVISIDTVVETAEAAADTITVGDADGVDVYNTAVSVGATAGTRYKGDHSSGAGAYIDKYYHAAGVISVVPSAALTLAKLTFTMGCVKIGVDASAS